MSTASLPRTRLIQRPRGKGCAGHFLLVVGPDRILSRVLSVSTLLYAAAVLGLDSETQTNYALLKRCDASTEMTHPKRLRRSERLDVLILGAHTQGTWQTPIPNSHTEQGEHGAYSSAHRSQPAVSSSFSKHRKDVQTCNPWNHHDPT